MLEIIHRVQSETRDSKAKLSDAVNFSWRRFILNAYLGPQNALSRLWRIVTLEVHSLIQPLSKEARSLRTELKELTSKNSFSLKGLNISSIRQAKQEAEVYDPETGEPLFHPKIGRAPKVGVSIVLFGGFNRIFREIMEICPLEIIYITSNLRSQIAREDYMRISKEAYRRICQD